jgi:SAM-dependent methyltransferase
MNAPRFFYGWDHPVTAERYEIFNQKPNRYSNANTALVALADLAESQQVLDFAAGTGRTAEIALTALPASAGIVCVEPAAAMRAVGQRRLPASAISWRADLPNEGGFDRILCGAALWQIDELSTLLARLRSLLRAGGVLCFTIPALYLNRPDRPGGGSDPHLHALMTQLAAGRTPHAEPHAPPPTEAQLLELLRSAGFTPRTEWFEYQLSQREYAAWLHIPVLTNALLGDMDANERIEAIERARAGVDAESFRFEGWSVWRAEVT